MKGCLGVVLGGIALLAILAVFLVPKMMANSKGARIYVEDTIQAIAPNWDLEELERRATPALKAKLTEAELAQFADFLATNLGKFDTLTDTVSCPNVSMGTSTAKGKYAIVECSAPARFEKSAGTFDLIVSKIDDQWYVQRFYVGTETTAPNEAVNDAP